MTGQPVHPPLAIHDAAAGHVAQDAPQSLPAVRASTTVVSAGIAGVILRIEAENFEDIMKLRIGVGNRLGAGATVQDAGSDLILAGLDQAKKACRRRMILALRSEFPTFAHWASTTPGLTEYSIGRVLAHVGHPNWRIVDHETGEIAPRSLRQLWAYCALGDPERRHRTGMSQEEALACGKTIVKIVLREVSKASVRNLTEPWRDIYDAAKAEYANRSEWTLAHRDNAALRLVSKEILRALWLLECPAAQSSSEDRGQPGGGVAVLT